MVRVRILEGVQLAEADDDRQAVAEAQHHGRWQEGDEAGEPGDGDRHHQKAGQNHLVRANKIELRSHKGLMESN